MMPPKNSLLHELIKQEIIQKPEMIGLRGVLSHREEVPYTNGRRILGQVDIVFWDKFGKPHAVEITTGRTPKAKRRLQRQVRMAKKHFSKTTAIGVVSGENGLKIFWV